MLFKISHWQALLGCLSKIICNKNEKKIVHFSKKHGLSSKPGRRGNKRLPLITIPTTEQQNDRNNLSLYQPGPGWLSRDGLAQPGRWKLEQHRGSFDQGSRGRRGCWLEGWGRGGKLNQRRKLDIKRFFSFNSAKNTANFINVEQLGRISASHKNVS
jgi:hypothetical protein